MKNFKLEIYTPNGVLFDGDVISVTLPGSKEKFTALINHAPLITSLTEGIIKYKTGDNVFTVNVLSGFAEIKNNVVTVCIETIKG